MRPIRERLSPKNLATRGVPSEYFDASLDQYPIDPDYKTTFTRYTENFDVMLEDCISLILFGANGTGKTYLASYVVKEAYRHRYSSYIFTLQRLVDMYFRKNKGDEKEKELWEDMMSCEFLVIDEVGKEAFDSKQYNIAIFEEILRTRDTYGLPVILCTNLPLEKTGGLFEQYGKSITSLIVGKMLQMEFDGSDNRHSVTAKKRGMQILTEEEEPGE